MFTKSWFVSVWPCETKKYAICFLKGDERSIIIHFMIENVLPVTRLSKDGDVKGIRIPTGLSLLAISLPIIWKHYCQYCWTFWAASQLELLAKWRARTGAAAKERGFQQLLIPWVLPTMVAMQQILSDGLPTTTLTGCQEITLLGWKTKWSWRSRRVLTPYKTSPSTFSCVSAIISM